MRNWVFLLIGGIMGAYLGKASGDNLKGVVFEKGSLRNNPLFHWYRVEETTPGGLQVHTVFENLDHTEAVRETTYFKDGKFLKHSFQQRQLNESGEIEVKGDKVYFTYTQDGKTENAVEDWEENFVTASNVIDYLIPRKEKVLKGESVKVRFGVMDRKETVGFKLFKVEEKQIEGVDVVVIKMKPTSIIIAAIVDPLYFTLRKDSFIPVVIEGRTFPKKWAKGKWKDLDAEIVYDSIKPQAAFLAPLK